MTMTSTSLKIFGWLIWRNMRVLKTDFVNHVIDAMVVPATFIIIAAYILPYIGLPANYGSFMLVSSMVLMAYSTANWRGASQLIVDLAGDKAVSYELTLPLPSWMVFVKFACTYALDAIFINILTLPLGKLLLQNKFDLTLFSAPKFILIYISMSLLFGFYALWTASWVEGMQGFTRFFLRYGSQLLFFSGFQYSWATLNMALPIFSYVNLLNPFVYAFEGMRAAVMGQAETLPFWISFVVIWVYIVIFGLLAIKNFKKRLDCL